MHVLKEKLFMSAMEDNKNNILSLLVEDSSAALLDLGCDEGGWTCRLMETIQTKTSFGIDIIDESLAKAKQVLRPVKSDLDKPLPFKSSSVNIIHANQVIEHLLDVDQFCEEIYRVLKPGGYVVISTENLSSWHNLFALSLGKQAFSQHISNRVAIGNPMSLHYGKDIKSESWAHIKIFTYYGLKELFEYYNFKDVQILAAGYYPMWGQISRWMSRIDPIHAHFITLRAFK